MVKTSHILLVTFPAQGHINPSLQFAKRLIRMGVQVTFATSASARRPMSKSMGIPAELRFVTFSDGHDDGFKLTDTDDSQRFMSEFRSQGSQCLKDIILSPAGTDRRPVTCLVYTILLPWAAEVARELHVPSALLWIQPASVFDIYYHYFHGYSEVIRKSCDDPSCSIELPGLPLLETCDLPSFLLPSNAFSFALPSFKDQMDTLDAETNPKVLVNTFDTLESEALKAISNLKFIAIGPLLPPAAALDNCFRADQFHKSGSYIEWLDSKQESSVVYISFGSISVLPKKQMEEIARGLLQSGRPFLWVVREKEEEKLISCIEELEQIGMTVPWCSQLEVLSHPSIGCFVTHCGWNSTLECLVCGVPMVAFPLWTDQGTNAKLIEDVWKTGVRVTATEEGLVCGEEVRSCIEMVMGGDERGEEMRRNAKKWKELGREAMKDGGSSDTNLKSFVEDIIGAF